MNYTSSPASTRHRFVPSSRINQISGKIIGACITVHRTLGPGLLESAYEACLSYELNTVGLQFERQKPVPLIYHSVKLDCGFRADIVVEGQVVVEIKSKEALHPVDHMQLLSHLRLLKLPVGLLINFHVTVLKDGITRLVNDYQEESASEIGHHEARVIARLQRSSPQSPRPFSALSAIKHFHEGERES